MFCAKIQKQSLPQGKKTASALDRKIHDIFKSIISADPSERQAHPLSDQTTDRRREKDLQRVVDPGCRADFPENGTPSSEGQLPSLPPKRVFT